MRVGALDELPAETLEFRAHSRRGRADQQDLPLAGLLEGVDFVFHLAGVNRPQNPKEFTSGNCDLTRDLYHAVAAVARSTGRIIPILYTSSTQATQDNAYGRSKREAEEVLATAAQDSLVPVYVFRLPNVFGKWCLHFSN